MNKGQTLEEFHAMLDRLQQKYGNAQHTTMERNQSKSNTKKPVKMNVSNRTVLKNLNSTIKSFGTLSQPETNIQSSSGYDSKKAEMHHAKKNPGFKFSRAGASKVVKQANSSGYNPAKVQRLRDEKKEREKKVENKIDMKNNYDQNRWPNVSVGKSKMSSGYNPQLVAEARKNLKRTQMSDRDIELMERAMIKR